MPPMTHLRAIRLDRIHADRRLPSPGSVNVATVAARRGSCTGAGSPWRTAAASAAHPPRRPAESPATLSEERPPGPGRRGAAVGGPHRHMASSARSRNRYGHSLVIEGEEGAVRSGDVMGGGWGEGGGGSSCRIGCRFSMTLLNAPRRDEDQTKRMHRRKRQLSDRSPSAISFRRSILLRREMIFVESMWPLRGHACVTPFWLSTVFHLRQSPDTDDGFGEAF